ncbi:MAG: protein translocase subunit yidC [Proteobacteria bacterium]|nr:protein translocase subunit yidC [Pseudomonadota bacterium]
METRRLILLSVFCFSIFMLWQNWQIYKQPKIPVTTSSNASPAAVPSVGTVPAAIPTAVPGAVATPAPASVPAGEAKEAQLVTVKTDLYQASFSSVGGDMVRLELLNYRDHADKGQNFVLFDAKHQYFAQSGFLPGAGLPDHRSLFSISGPTEMAEGINELKIRLTPVQSALKASKVYTLKRGSYLIDVSWEIENTSQSPVTPNAYYQLQRDDVAPAGESSMVSTFTGPAVFTNEGKYQKVDIGDIVKEKAKFTQKADNGWLAMVQHYFVAAWVPKAPQQREFYMSKLDSAKNHLVRAGMIVPLASVAPGGKTTYSMSLYAGPQEQSVLKQVAPGLELVVDYGWLTVVASPIFWALEWIHKLVGNWGWAIVILTICIKLVFFPLSAASYKSMAKMKNLAPQMTALKERYGDDRQRLNQEMMNLYKTEKVNPLGGCLPILIQIPVFIALYWVLLGAVEMRDAPWILWIKDLSAPDALFGHLPIIGWPIGPLPIVMVISMLIQTKLNPTPPDPVQAKVMQIMPFAFGLMFFNFPSGLVLYWVVNNILSIAQQWQITRLIDGKGKGKKAANDAKA